MSAQDETSAEYLVDGGPRAPRPATETRLWLAQRLSAMVLGVCVVVHLATIVIAVRGGLTAAEITARVAGNPYWEAFYLVFVLAVSVHAPIGLRSVLSEMTSLPPKRVDLLCFVVAALLLVLGIRVVMKFHGLGGAA
jgi:fumarate reductase subunit C